MKGHDRIAFLKRKIEGIERSNERMCECLAKGGSAKYYAEKIIYNNGVIQRCEDEIANKEE